VWKQNYNFLLSTASTYIVLDVTKPHDSFHLTLITPTTSNTEEAMQQIIMAYMKNLSSADKQITQQHFYWQSNISNRNWNILEIIFLNDMYKNRGIKIELMHKSQKS